MDTVLEFLYNPALEDEGLGDAGIETFRETPYASAAKEAGQNSRDAMENHPVVLKIKLREIEREDIPCIAQLSETIDACLQRVEERPNEKEEDFFKRARHILDQDKIKVLEMADYNTRGLEGPAIPGKPFYALLKSSGVSNKRQGETSIGSFGIGKNASFAISDLQTVFYSTVYKDKDSGEKRFLAQGKVKLVSHTDADELPRKATGWWGLPDYKEIDESGFVPDWLKRDEIGTSVFSIGFREEENWHFRVAAAVIKTFFVAIHDGDMVFEVNEDLIIDKTTLHQLFQDQRIVEAAAASHTEDDFKFAQSLYECLISEEASSKVATITQSGTTKLGDVDIRILKRTGLPKRVGIVRNGMMITDNLKNFDHAFRTFPMCSEFVALIRPLESSGSELMKKLENPAHDSFSSQRIADETRQQEAFRLIKKLGLTIRETIRSETLSKPEDVEELTELAEFFADESQPDKEGDNDPTPTKLKYKLGRKKATKTHDTENKSGSNGGGSGTGGGGTSGGGTSGSGSSRGGTDDDKGSKGSKGSKKIDLNQVRYIERKKSKLLKFTPSSSGKAEVKVFATGLSQPESLAIKTASEGTTLNGSLIIDFSKEKRLSIEVSFSEDYSGPVELQAYSKEETNNEN